VLQRCKVNRGWAYDQPHVNPGFDVDDELFAFNPASVSGWPGTSAAPLSVVAPPPFAAGRKAGAGDTGRLWKGLESVRPAGVRALLAVDERDRPARQAIEGR